jgi:periplasmic divalent cation tolerance protein
MTDRPAASYIFVYVTAPDQAVAARLAQEIVGARLAACANILPGMRSLYHWQGKIEQAEETVLIFKAPAAQFAAIEARIKSLHPYDTPCIVALPVTDGHAPYLRWIDSETAEAK